MYLECECKNVSIYWHTHREKFSSRQCSCEYCQSNNAAYVSDPNSSFEFAIDNLKAHRIIKHGHKTANFHECKNCGLAFVICDINGQRYGVINAQVMGLQNCMLEPTPENHTGESVGERLKRRKRNWCCVNS